MHFASKAGDLPIVKRLVESKASLEQQTLTGKVAAKFAASASHSDVLSFLLKKTCNTKTLMDDEQVRNESNYQVYLLTLSVLIDFNSTY